MVTRPLTRQVLRIFISSTAIDLGGYRDKVRDAVLRLENVPIAMETFSAQSGQPASECMRMAAEADAVICIVAHRYGYVPPKELGGDGERSITWLEVDAAKRAGKPVFAFLVDPKAAWTQESAIRRNNNGDLCRSNSLLALVLLPDDPAQAAGCLQDARAFANRSGVVEFQLRCVHAACELHRHLGDYPQAITEADAGVLLADTCGFGRYSIDLRLALAETYLAAGDARKALQNARNALDRSEHPDCQYAWGRADGLHFCGLAHLRLGESKLARQRLTAALELRERLGHGRVEETRRALGLCQG